MRLELLVAVASIFLWLLLAWFTLFRRRGRRNAPALPAAAGSSGAQTAVVYASQTGTAIEIAQRTAQALGSRAILLSMDETHPEQLRLYPHVLFIVSTYGEGDPPDMAQGFHEAMSAPVQASTTWESVEVGILALGDSSYTRYCGFGIALDEWLHERGAQFMFDTLKADRADPRTFDAWASALSKRFQVSLDTHLTFEPWTLVERTTLNPNGLGRRCHELLWRPDRPQALRWQAGDIAIVEIDDTEQRREYSIASTPTEGVLRLLVREHERPDGSPGLGSGWLTGSLPVGGFARLHLRSNPLFHAPKDDRPAIFIGNGTGIAGLRSLIQERIERGHHLNWLIFGERGRATDFHWGAQLQEWLAQGRLARMDLAFSRDQIQKRYVHHLIRESADVVREWAGRGAHFYVCGSKDGMAQDVDQALREALGAHGYDALLQRQGYRRDVY